MQVCLLTADYMADIAYRHGWYTKAVHRSCRPFSFLVYFAELYGETTEEMYEVLIARYRDGYRACPPDWVPPKG